jgi:hypothetical protein
MSKKSNATVARWASILARIRSTSSVDAIQRQLNEPVPVVRQLNEAVIWPP